jgi:hypothetical protein
MRGLPRGAGIAILGHFFKLEAVAQSSAFDCAWPIRSIGATSLSLGQPGR